MNGTNVEAAFLELTRAILKKVPRDQGIAAPNTRIHNLNAKPQSSSCC